MRLCGPVAQQEGRTSVRLPVCLSGHAYPTQGSGHLEPEHTRAHALQILNMLISLAIQFS